MADVDDTEAKEAAAAEIVGSDLLLEIFRRVPSEKKDDRNRRFKFASKHLKSLLASEYCSLSRLRLVSRRWNSLISNNFPRNRKPFPAAGLIFECGPTRSKHTTTTAHPNYILFIDKSIITTSPFRKINPANDTWHSRSKVLHSCNGLLLCASKRTCSVCDKHRAHRDYSVCNPTTGAHLTLPQVPRAHRQIVCGVYLAFDPHKSPHYKVVCVLGLDQAGCKFCRYCQFVVYSSETGCWGKCGELFEANNVRFRNNNGVFWNGAIHWVGSSKLICFNPGDDCEDRLPAPKVMPMPIARHHDQRYYFGESCGHLHYICFENGVREVVVHEMSSDYSAGWVVKYKLDVSNVVRRSRYFPDDNYDDFNVFPVVRGERDEDTFLVLGTSGWRPGGWKKIVRFNHDATFKTIFDFDAYEKPLQNPGEFTYPFQYIESLASV